MMNFGFFDWLSPTKTTYAKAKARRLSSRQGLIGFPGTPDYGSGRQRPRPSGGLVGLLGFPSTPAYQDASIQTPEEPEEPEAPECSDSESPYGEDPWADDSDDSDDSAESKSQVHGTR